MAFADSIEILDGERLSLTTKATVQSTGRLNFTPATATCRGITSNSTVILLKAGERDRATNVKPCEHRRGFKVKKTGPYFYIQLKNYLEEQGIDYKGKTRVVFDITKLGENYEDQPLFKMIRRDIIHEPKVQNAPESVKNALAGVPSDGAGNDSSSAENAPTAQGNA